MILSSTLEILKECLPMEATAVMKFKEGAVNTNDAVLRGLFMSRQHPSTLTITTHF